MRAKAGIWWSATLSTGLGSSALRQEEEFDTLARPG
jgi:hypothetical protein